VARTILAVVAGYIVMALLVFLSFSAAFLMMGTDRAFQPGTYGVSALWLTVSFVLGLVAAIVGGYACAAIAPRSRAPMALAVVVLVLGLAMAVPVLTAPDAGVPRQRAGDVGNTEAMMQAQQPPWVALANPFLGAAGVMIGARRRRT
jgi:hypothetical protein